MSVSTAVDRVRGSLGRLLGRDGVVRARPLGPSPVNPAETLVRVAVRFAGRMLDLTVREGTTDVDLIGMILRRDGVYRLPETVRPKVIFDSCWSAGTLHSVKSTVSVAENSQLHQTK